MTDIAATDQAVLTETLVTFATSIVYGRLVDLRAVPLVGAVVTAQPVAVTPTQQPASQTLVANAVSATTDSVGTCQLVLSPTQSMVPVGQRYVVRGPSEWKETLIVPEYPRSYLDGGILTDASPTWGTISACLVSGQVMSVGGQFIPGLSLTFWLDVPADTLVTLSDHTIVIPVLKQAMTGVDGRFVIPLIPTVLLSPQGVSVVAQLGTEILGRFIVPNQAGAWLPNLLI